MKTVKLITCNDAMKAHILQGALENEGAVLREWISWWRMKIMRKPFRC